MGISSERYIAVFYGRNYSLRTGVIEGGILTRPAWVVDFKAEKAKT